MTLKEAIETLRYIKFYKADKDSVEPYALDLAIKALEERPKGKWKKIGEEYYNWHNHDVIKCLRCGYIKDIPWDKTTPHFCEECGADMRGEEE